MDAERLGRSSATRHRAGCCRTGRPGDADERHERARSRSESPLTHVRTQRRPSRREKPPMFRTRRTDAERCSPSPFGEQWIVRRIADEEWHLDGAAFDEFCGPEGLRLDAWIAD